ncbi:transposase [Pedobacter sp.]
MVKHFKSLADIERHFDYGWDCREYIESLRWKDGLFSPYTGSKNVKQIGRYDTYVCLDTGRSFSALTGTIFANSKVKLLHWFQVIWLNWLHPDLSSAEISRQVGINQKTVWSMLKKINAAQNPV